MAINLPPFYNRHGSEVLFLPRLVRELRIAPRHIQRTVPHQRLETLNPHAGIEKLTGKGMAKRMQGIPLMGKTGFRIIAGQEGGQNHRIKRGRRLKMTKMNT